jgi:hypothetical protein
MSKNTIVLNTGQQLTVTTDLSKIFVWNNRYESGTYNNSTYETVDLLQGTVMGRIAATGLLVPLESDAADGSQYPVGILASDYSVEEGEEQELAICVAGDVDETLLVFAKDGDDLDTVISGRQIRDRIGADTVGVKLVGGTEHTKFDNQ